MLDIAEGGVTFARKANDAFTVGDLVQCTVTLLNGEALGRSGIIARVEQSAVAVVLAEPIPPDTIQSERDNLTATYRLLRPEA